MQQGKYIRWIQEKHPEIVSLLKQTSHHYTDENTGEVVLNEFHLEDDVWSHTCMVVRLAELFNAPDNVVIAALLHDVGKPYARFNNPETKKARFIGHEGVSFYTAINLVLEIAETKKDAEEILRIIAMHSVIFDHFRDSVTSKSIKKLANKFSFNDRAFFEKLTIQVSADNEGRFFADNKNFEEFVMPYFNEEFFSNFSVKQSYCGQPILHFLIGPQMTGKTDLARTLTGEILSRDVFIDEYCETFNCNKKELTEEDNQAIEMEYEKKFNELVSKNKNIILDRSNMNRSTRSKFSHKADDYYKIAYIMAVDIHTIFEKCETINMQKDDVIDKCKKFSFPAYDEVDEIRFIF